MKCQVTTDDKLCAFSFESLENGEMAALRTHLETCAECQERLKAIKKRMALLDGWGGIQASEDLAARVFERLKRHRRTVRIIWTIAFVLFLAFCGVIISIALRLAMVRLVKKNVMLLDKAIQCYQNEHGQYPASAADVWKCINGSASGTPYVKLEKFSVNAQGLVVDRWGNPYIYVYPGARNRGLVDLYSAGWNGVDEKGEGDDIPNWEREE